jgi:hypothetical protein
MTKGKSSKIIGAWIFLIGIVLAFAIGLFSDQIGPVWQKAILGILIVLGIIIGFLNIKNNESSKFLLAGAVLVIVSFMGQSFLAIIPQISKILSALLILFVPAILIVALKEMFALSKN